MKKILFLITFVFAASLITAQNKADQIAAYLGARYATVAPAGKWEFYFATTTVGRVSDGTKYFPELLAAAPNWSNAPDGQLEQIRWNGKKITDMREAKTQSEKPAAQKLRMVGSGNLDSLKIADGVQHIMQEGPKQIILFWASAIFEVLAHFVIALVGFFYFMTKSCLNETRINANGFPVVGRYMYFVGNFFSSILNGLVIVSGGFLVITLYAVVLSSSFIEFIFSWTIIRIAITAASFSAINWVVLGMVDKATPTPPMVDETRLGIKFNGGGQSGLPMGGRR
jgi:hypothetical protein